MIRIFIAGPDGEVVVEGGPAQVVARIGLALRKWPWVEGDFRLTVTPYPDAPPRPEPAPVEG
jgi:hypothetical protein